MIAMQINDADAKVFADLRRFHLRSPGSVKPSIVKLLKNEFLTRKQIGDARLEWLRLGGKA